MSCVKNFIDLIAIPRGRSVLRICLVSLRANLPAKICGGRVSEAICLSKQIASSQKPLLAMTTLNTYRMQYVPTISSPSRPMITRTENVLW